MRRPSFRGVAKGVVERALAPVAWRARRKQARRGGAVILAYHNVVEREHAGRGDRSLHLPLDDFLEQIDRLALTHDIVPLTTLTSGPASGGRPRAAVTFDDAYRGTLRLAMPALAARGIPTTLFVPPGLLGGRGFWWDLLAVGGSGLPPATRERALGADAGRPHVPEGIAAPAPDYEPGTVAEVLEALALPGMEGGSHTWSHANLTALSDRDLRDELERSRAWVTDHLGGAAADHLSFPYGLWDERVGRAAKAAGYRFLYRVEGGAALPEGGSFPAVLPRVNLPAGVSLRGFDLRLAGLFGEG